MARLTGTERLLATTAPPGEADRHAGDATGNRSPWVAFAVVYSAVLLALLWGRTLEAPVLVAAGVSVLAAIPLVRWGAGSQFRALLYGALAAVVLALVAGTVTEQRLARISTDWSELVAARDARLAATLERRLGAEIASAREAAARAAALAAEGLAEPELFARLGELRATSGVAALTVVDDVGEFVAWAGEHHGLMSAEVRTGQAGAAFREQPLVSYLYFSAPVEGRGTGAVAALLLESAIPAERPYDFASRFESGTRARPEFGAARHPASTWRLEEEGRAVVHARFEPPSQSEWRARIATDGRRVAIGFSAAALLLLALAWTRSRRGLPEPGATRAAAAPLGGIAVALAAAPLGPVLGLERLFSPALFLLPIPGDIVLGTVLAVLLPLGALAAAFTPGVLRGGRPELRLLAGGAVVAFGFPLALKAFLAGSAPQLLEDGFYLWAALFPTTALMLTVLSALALPQPRPHAIRAAPIVSAAALSAALGVAVATRWHPDQGVQLWLAGLWAVPFILFGLGLAGYTGRAGRIARWLAMGWLAATAVLPHLWTAHVEAKLHAAERELESLGLRADPFVDYLLRQFAREVSSRFAAGEAGVPLLFRSWGESGLGHEAGPARVTLWRWDPESSPHSEADLVLGEPGAAREAPLPPGVLVEVMRRARAAGEPIIETSYELGGEHVLAVPLDDETVVSVVVPPRRTLERSTALLPFLGTEPRPEAKLTLIPAALAHPIPTDDVGWRATESGWRSEAIVRYPDGEYHAHLDLRVPPKGVRLARAVLLTVALLGLLTLLWAVGRLVRGDPPGPPDGWRDWFGSFRARVTLALFAFFLAPTVIFGAVAYSALAGEGPRAARYVAERAVDQAVATFPASGGDLRALAASMGHEVLYYYRGELAGASSPEALQLGVFDAWMPPEVYRLLYGGEELAAVHEVGIAERPHAVAYRRLQPAGSLAVPVPLSAGDAVLRQAELAHLILFAVLMGGLLSLALSVAVGRALSGPIGQLRRAAAAVGGGRLQVRLPEDRADEFGEVFASFNRMVRRLRRARAREVRTARVLAWGEMARQIAHGIKNPLTPIKLSVQHIRRAYADCRPEFGKILETNVDEVLREIDRLGDLARAFSRYGAPGAAGELERVDVASVAAEALTLYRAGDRAVAYRQSLQPELPPVRARSAELKEVLLNLLENARQALDGAPGTIAVEAVRSGDGVEIVVRDDGQGIPEELLPRIFDPHFSTRSYGTGLGLAIVRRLVESWGGRVAADSEPGRGTRVRIWVPAADEVVPHPPRTGEAPTGGGPGS